MLNNVLADIPTPLSAELFTTLLDASNIRIERIVSQGHSSPEGFWYDQEQHEWVIVLQGRARLQFEHDSQPVELFPGSFVNIPAHTRHRVEWTSACEQTIWLAIHYSDHRPRVDV